MDIFKGSNDTPLSQPLTRAVAACTAGPRPHLEGRGRRDGNDEPTYPRRRAGNVISSSMAGIFEHSIVNAAGRVLLTPSQSAVELRFFSSHSWRFCTGNATNIGSCQLSREACPLPSPPRPSFCHSHELSLDQQAGGLKLDFTKFDDTQRPRTSERYLGERSGSYWDVQLAGARGFAGKLGNEIICWRAN